MGRKKLSPVKLYVQLLNMIKTLNYLFVTCFGVGSLRFAPGTITSLVTTIFLYSLFNIVNLSSNIILLILLVFIFFYAVSEYINIMKTRSKIIVDEFIGNPPNLSS